MNQNQPLINATHQSSAESQDFIASLTKSDISLNKEPNHQSEQYDFFKKISSNLEFVRIRFLLIVITYWNSPEIVDLRFFNL